VHPPRPWPPRHASDEDGRFLSAVTRYPLGGEALRSDGGRLEPVLEPLPGQRDARTAQARGHGQNLQGAIGGADEAHLLAVVMLAHRETVAATCRAVGSLKLHCVAGRLVVGLLPRLGDDCLRLADVLGSVEVPASAGGQIRRIVCQSPSNLSLFLRSTPSQ
jgi:hypothetical protein